jgi:hypothetical protein
LAGLEPATVCTLLRSGRELFGFRFRCLSIDRTRKFLPGAARHKGWRDTQNMSLRRAKRGSNPQRGNTGLRRRPIASSQ